MVEVSSKTTKFTLRLLVGSVVKGLRPAFLGAGLPSPGEWPSSAGEKGLPRDIEREKRRDGEWR